MANDIKELKKDTEMLKNRHNDSKKEFKGYLENSINQLTQKIESETLEQKEYIRSLHQDIDDAIKRGKRDRSDNFLEINKLIAKLKIVEETSKKTETDLLKTAGVYISVLENIKIHLYILQQKEQHKFDSIILEENSKPYVAAEGDLLNAGRKNIIQRKKVSNPDVEYLETQMSKLEDIMNDNYRMYQSHFKNEFEHYEEQKNMIKSMQTKARLTSPDSMPRLKSAKKRPAFPIKHVRPTSLHLRKPMVFDVVNI